MIRVFATADTHRLHEQLDISAINGADWLIHCGDFGGFKEQETRSFFEWSHKIVARHKFMVLGNHDYYLMQLEQREGTEGVRKLVQDYGFIYLNKTLHKVSVENRVVALAGLSYQSRDSDCFWAQDIGQTSLSVLITHNPPRGILDHVEKDSSHSTESPGHVYQTQTYGIGNDNIMALVTDLKPQYHFFGHCHEGHGQKKQGDTLFVNAAAQKSRILLRPFQVVEV
ncbi:MAG: metallophosphoesterase [SAR324 cluster bacterium]|nr:metallophosphoesterase [SAR324 cluster bacterium]